MRKLVFNPLTGKMDYAGEEKANSVILVDDWSNNSHVSLSRQEAYLNLAPGERAVLYPINVDGIMGIIIYPNTSINLEKGGTETYEIILHTGAIAPVVSMPISIDWAEIPVLDSNSIYVIVIDISYHAGLVNGYVGFGFWKKIV